MSLYDEHPLTSFDRKTLEAFGEHVVLKSLAQQSAFHRLPRFVSDYLIAKFVKPATWRDDLKKIEDRIRQLLPEHDHREILKNQLLTKGQVVLIDNIDVRVDLNRAQRWANVPAISDRNVRVAPAIVEQHPGLLLGGLWGTAEICYRPENDGAAPNELVSFVPFQVGPPNLDEYRSIRSKFNADEWTSLMLQSAGYAAEAFPDRRSRLLLLSRMIPLVERNVNMMELGPRQTGKTFLLRNLSPRVFTVSGGRTSPANLFVNLSTRQVGILGARKVVVFDEIAHVTFGGESESISTLKDYMESGQFGRGSMSFTADASIVLAGNLDVQGSQPHPRYPHLLSPLPNELIDSALHDRMHGFVPGWEVPKMTPASIATGVGLLGDYFGEVLVRLRDVSFADRVRGVPMHAGLTRRDMTAVERLTSGLLKILYPDGNYTPEELHELVTFASELRHRVHAQLCKLAPGEFKERMIGPADVRQHQARDLLPQQAVDEPPENPRVGEVTGLGVISDGEREYGGDLIIIQIKAIPGWSNVVVTGLHGSALNDSVRAVYNLVKSRLGEFGISDQDIKTKTVAVHLVKIAEPKDGPSAGLAFFVGMVSALTNRKIKPGFAFSGEVSLFGDVTAVGGIPLKIQAALSKGRKHVVMPEANLASLGDLDEQTLKAVTIHPVSTVSEALAIALEPRA